MRDFIERTQRDRMDSLVEEKDEAEHIKGVIEDLWDEIEDKKRELEACVEKARNILESIEDDIEFKDYEDEFESEDDFEATDTDTYMDAEKLVEEIEGYGDELERYCR